MANDQYFYKFLEPLSEELAYVARELENSIFTSPRTMLTHSRTFVEAIVEKVLVAEEIKFDPYDALVERLGYLNYKGILTSNVRDALHNIRKWGNQASHQARPFRYSEALLSWEQIYIIVKWYVEVYGPLDLKVPDYQDPELEQEESYDMAELEVRLKSLEELLKNSLTQTEQTSENNEVAATVSETNNKNVPPGFTTIRKITYKDRELEVPYFLRDAFLLPQRFNKSERFLVRLGAEEQARIMSELPENLEGLHTFVKRYNDSNDEVLFEELKLFIDEEKKRRELILARPGELFLCYRDDYIVVTEALSEVELITENFTSVTSLLRQLNEAKIHTVGQLPKELVILAKYSNVGVGTVENLFSQLKVKQHRSQEVS